MRAGDGFFIYHKGLAAVKRSASDRKLSVPARFAPG